MSNNKMEQILQQLFQKTKPSQEAKKNLKSKLFGGIELHDDSLSSVTAAGDLEESKRKKNDKKGEK